MGMFDTVHFAEPVACAICQAPIPSTQTKAFDSTLDDYRIGDCIGHAEEIRVVREDLFCDACHAYNKQFVYLVVYRGILIDIALDLPAAEPQLHSFSFERLLLWYHDQYAKRISERRDRLAVERFLHDLVRWFDEGYDQMTPEERAEKHWPFFIHKDILEGASDPVTALRVYVEQHGTVDEA